jgi:acetyl-CoA carboxylase biotin carboxyl carrier protein
MDLEPIKQLIALLQDNQLNEIEVKDGETSIKIRKENAPATSAALMTNSTHQPHEQLSPSSAPFAALTGHVEKSPMVGTVYLAKTPGAKPFVAVGQTIKAGDTLCMIEAMKVFNPIKATQNGIIGARFIDDGQAVEFNEALFTITQS